MRLYLAALGIGIALLVACGTDQPLGPERYPVELVVVDQLSPDWTHARTVSPNRILILEEYREIIPLIAHELCHVVQWNTFGGLFSQMYAWQYLRYGYEQMPFEIECYILQDDPWYLEWAEELAATLE